MTDRGLPIVDGAPACPFVAFEDERDERSTRPDHRHRCFAEARPAPRALAHQDAYCLSPSFPACPTFQDWARREAAVPRAPLRSDADEGMRPTVRRGRRDWAAPPPWLSGDAARTTDRPPSDAAEEEDDDVIPGVGAAASAASELGFLTSAAASPATPSGTAAGSRPPGPSIPASRPSSSRPVLERSDGEAYATEGRGGLAASAAAWLGDEPDDDVAEADADEAPEKAARPTATPGRVRRRPTLDTDVRRERTSARRDSGGPIVHGPEWEEPHRQEAYPTLRMPLALPNLSRVGLGFIALIIAAVVLFFVPPMLLKLGAGGEAAPTDTPAPSAAASASLAPTPVPQPTPFVYTVKEGDTLSRIAARYKTTISDIMAANPQIKNPNSLAIGDQVMIPTPASTSVSDTTTGAEATTVPAASASAP